MNAIQAVITVLTEAWRFLYSVQVPGLNVSFASLYLGVFIVGVSFIVIKHFRSVNSE